MMRTTIPTLLIISVFFFHSVELSSHGVSSSGGRVKDPLERIYELQDLLDDSESVIRAGSFLLSKVDSEEERLIEFSNGENLCQYHYTTLIPDDPNLPLEKVWERMNVSTEKWLDDLKKYAARKKKNEWIRTKAEVIAAVYNKKQRMAEEMRKVKEMLLAQQMHGAQEIHQAQLLNPRMAVFPGASHNPMTISNAELEHLRHAAMAQQSFNTLNQAQKIHQSQSSYPHMTVPPDSAHGHMNQYWPPQNNPDTQLQHLQYAMMAQKQSNTYNPLHGNFHIPMDPRMSQHPFSNAPQEFERIPHHHTEHQQGVTLNLYSSANQEVFHNTRNRHPEVTNYEHSSGASAKSHQGASSSSEPLNLELSLSQPRNLHVDTSRRSETSPNSRVLSTARVSSGQRTQKRRPEFHREV